MDARLVVESEEAVRLANELAELTGKSVPDAVTDALKAKVEREREIHERAERIRAAAAEIRSHLRPPLPSSDHGWLYGDDGLPA
jgi:antitoxin VapB